MTLEVVSLGCRLNLSESEQLRGVLSGVENITIVNSCAVTAEAVRQTRQAIRRARKARPNARLLVTGCAAEVERDALAAMPEVDGLIPNSVKLDPRAWNAPPSRFAPHARHTRAFIDVQNGCDHACTFCVIPQGRGPSRSRDVKAVVADIGCHLEAGAQEVVLTGVDLTSWGHDLIPGTRLGTLVAAILDAFPALERLRLSSLDGIEIDAQLFELLSDEPRVMPHVHLSLQSGDDMILKRMKRRHSRYDAVRLVERLRSRRPEVAIGADLIAGFPTEDDAMHANNLSIIDELNIVHGHIFPYSPRPGTAAARMPQVLSSVIKARAADLRQAVNRQRDAWLNSLIGTELKVLAERDGTGHAENFARVRLPPSRARNESSHQPHVLAITPTLVSEGMLA